MTGEIDHVMIRVEELEPSVDWYKTHFEYVEVRDRTEADTFTNVFLAPEKLHEDAAYLELTFNHDGRTYDLGDAWSHLAVRVEDVDTAYDRLVEEGVDAVRSPDDTNGEYAFVRDPDGHGIQLLESDDGAPFELDHAAWHASDADAGVGWFVRKFGYELVDRVENDDFESLFVRRPDADPREAAVEIRYEYDGGEYTMGDAWGHIAVRVGDLHETWDALMKREAEDYRPPETCNNQYAFTKFEDGHEIDLHPH